MEFPVAARQLVDLRERALDEAGGAADEGDEPHPEDRAGPTRDDCDGDARDVADAHARGGAHAERLERADGMSLGLLADALREEPQHLWQHPDLDKARGKGEIEPARDEDDDEYIRPENVIDGIDRRIHTIHWYLLDNRKVKIIAIAIILDLL